VEWDFDLYGELNKSDVFIFRNNIMALDKILYMFLHFVKIYKNIIN
jgi:hypothetical protein